MTGEKNKGTTAEKLWNLDDKTLKTPEHDKLVCELLNKDKLRKILMLLEDTTIVSIKSEVPIITYNKFIIGYWDVVVNIIRRHKDGTVWMDITYYIEVKPKIDSFGATLRQLNTYRQYCPSQHILLYTPDISYEKEFNSQGISVMRPI